MALEVLRAFQKVTLKLFRVHCPKTRPLLGEADGSGPNWEAQPQSWLPQKLAWQSHLGLLVHQEENSSETLEMPPFWWSPASR